MTTRVTLLCHAATAATRAGRFPADEALEDEAAVAALAGRLPRADRVLAGSEVRTRATAAALGLAAETVAALNDCDFGRWRGRALAEIATESPDDVGLWLSDPDAAPHGGESITALIARAGGWLDTVTALKSLVAVTHPALLRATAVYVLGAPPASFWKIDAGPLATIDLRHDGRRWQLRAPALG